MTFTAGATGGSYNTGKLYVPNGSYGLTNNSPQFGGRPIVWENQAQLGKWFGLDNKQPFMGVYHFRRTA